MSRRAQENVVALVLLMAFIGFLVIGMDYSPKARLVPVPLSIASILLISLQLYLQNFRTDIKLNVDAMDLFAKQTEECKEVAPVSPGRSRGRKELAGIGLVTLFVAMFLVIGQFPSVLLFIFGYFILVGKARLLTSALYSVVTTAVLYLLFSSVLGVPPYGGLIGPLL